MMMNHFIGTGIQVREDSPSHGQLIDSYPFSEALMIGRNALIANRASLYLVQRHCKKYVYYKNFLGK